MWFFSIKGQFLLSPLSLTAPSSKSIALKRASIGATASFVLFQGHFRVCPWQLQSHSEDRRRTIHQTEDMKSRSSRRKIRCKCPPHHVTEIGFASYPSPALSSRDTPKAQAATIPSACSLPLSWERGKQGAAGNQLSWMHPRSHSSNGSNQDVELQLIFSALCSRLQCCTTCAFSAAVQGGFPKHTALPAPDVTLTFHCNAAAGREGFQADPKPSLPRACWNLSKAAPWQVQPCWRAGRAVIRSCGWALCQGLTLQKGLSLRGALQILLQVL